MGFRFYKRISIGKGWGLNISCSGITPNVRTKLGSFSTKGYFLKTGIPGLRYTARGCMLGILFYIGIGLSLVVFLSCGNQPETPVERQELPPVNEKVYVCKSAGARKYHPDPGCHCLERCTHEIIAMPREQAEKRGLGLCGFED